MTTQLEGPAMRLSPTSTRRWFEVAVVSFSALRQTGRTAMKRSGARRLSPEGLIEEAYRVRRQGLRD